MNRLIVTIAPLEDFKKTLAPFLINCPLTFLMSN